jgi:thiol-disulfide isomerase/thioredoxin
MAWLFSLSALAEEKVSLTISGDMSLSQSLKAYVEKYDKTGYTALDTISAVDGIYQFTIDNSKASFYRVRIDGLPDIPLIADTAEHAIELAGWLDNYKEGNYVCFQSPVNQCYLKVKRAERDFGNTYHGLVSGLRDQHLDPAMKAVFEGRMEQAIQSYNDQLKSLQAAYPNTICADFIIPNLLFMLKQEDAQWFKSYPQYIDFMAVHFFDHYDLSDPRQLAFPMLLETLKYYRNDWAAKDTTLQKQWISRLLTDRKTDKDVKLFLVSYLLHNYAVEYNGTAVYQVLRSMEPLTPDTATADGRYITTLKALQPGMKAFDFSLPDSTGRYTFLSDLCGRQPFTILLFYSHDCDHCQQEIAKIKSELSQFIPARLGVLAVDINPDRAGWQRFVAEQQLPFINRLLEGLYAPEALNHYLVTGVPVIILLDKDARIIDRFATVAGVRAAIK